MSAFAKKSTVLCYCLSLFTLSGLLLWGLTGMLGGGGLIYRVFGFYAFVPLVAVIAGFILGLTNAPMKRLYPVVITACGQLTYWLMFRHRFAIMPGNAYFIVPFSAALFGVSTGYFIWGLSDKRKIQLKKIAKVAAAIGSVIAMIHIAHAATLDRTVEYTEITFYSQRLPAGLDGYKIAFIADTHRLSEGRMWGIVEEINRRGPDLVVLGGDFSSYTAEMQRTIEILSHIRAPDGIFGVEGNHDDYRMLFAAMQAHGMTPLSNSGYTVRDGFFLAGVEDLWNRSPDVAAALAGSQPGDFVLLITHNPDVAMQQCTASVDLILSGHTHGGQFSFFGIWAPYFTFGGGTITSYGQRFRGGWALSRDDVPVYVSRGAGEYLPRVFARPEVVLVTLRVGE